MAVSPVSTAMSLYNKASKDRLRKFISTCGGIEEAAYRLDVYGAALIQVLHDEPVPKYVRRNIEDMVGPLKQAQRTPPTKFKHRLVPRTERLTSWPDQSRLEVSGEALSPRPDLRVRLQELMNGNNEVAVLEVASRLGVNPSSVKKILSGEAISGTLETKLRFALESVGPLESNEYRRPSIANRLRAVFNLYEELGTLEEVGKRMGITRERVRQLLARGTALGLFEYRPYNYPYVSKDKIISDFVESRSLGQVARINGISQGYLKKLLTAYSISQADLSAFRKKGQKGRCVKEYSAFRDRYGHHPTTTELQSTSKGHAISTRICRLWGSIDAFRKELDIPAPVRVYPHWLEPRRRLALIARMQHLDTLRDCLSSARPKSVSELAYDCSFTANRVRRLLKLLIASREIEILGTGSNTKYRLYLH